MIIRYNNGKVSRIRLDFSDIPFLRKLTDILRPSDVIENHQKLLEAVIDKLGNEEQYSILTYQNKKVWLTIL